MRVSVYLSQLGKLGLKPTPLTVRPESTVTVRRLVQELLVNPLFHVRRARGHPTTRLDAAREKTYPGLAWLGQTVGGASSVYAVYAMSSLDTGSPLRHRTQNMLFMLFMQYARSTLVPP